MYKYLHIPLYREHVHILLGDSYEDYLKTIKKISSKFTYVEITREQYLAEFPAISHDDWEEGGGFCQTLASNNHLICLKNLDLSSSGSHNELAHEVSHLVMMIFEERGMTHTRENSEAFAYLTGWLVEEIVKVMSDHFQKISQKGAKKPRKGSGGK